MSPVPSGTDGSTSIYLCSSYCLSRPFGDGWFRPAPVYEDSRGVPSLRGRMVPLHKFSSMLSPCPVPTGTDSSIPSFLILIRSASRHLGDGWFLSCNHLYIIIEPEDSGIDQLSRQRNNELCRDAARCGVYIGLCGNLKPNRFSIELKENALRALHILQGP